MGEMAEAINFEEVRQNRQLNRKGTTYDPKQKRRRRTGVSRKYEQAMLPIAGFSKMTRPIKFRAWDKNQNKWVASFAIDQSGCWQDYPDEHKDASEFDLMQFTGLLDKNGKEIFEMDIIRSSEGRGVIKFYNGDYCIDWAVFDDWCGVSCTGLNTQNNICEIIGNIYENPELLKGNSNANSIERSNN